MNYHLLLITQTDLNIYYCSLFLYDIYLDITFYICILLDNGPQILNRKLNVKPHECHKKPGMKSGASVQWIFTPSTRRYALVINRTDFNE